MKRFIYCLSLVSVLLFLGCEEKTILQSETGSYSYQYANVELIFNSESVFGNQLTLNNANAKPVGVYIVDNNNPSLVVFSDNWTWNGNTSTSNYVNFEQGQELKVTIVIYSEAGIVAFPIISLLGPNFIPGLADAWIQDKHEEVIILQ